MKSITFDEGYSEYMIADDPNRVIRLRLGDPGLLKRIRAAMQETDKLLKKYKAMPDEEALAEFDKEFRGIINKAFAADICTPVFGDSSVLALTSSGEFLFTAFFDAFLPQLEADLKAKAMTAKVNAPEPRSEVKKYLDAPTVKPVAGLAKPYGEELPDVSNLTPEKKKQLLALLLS